MSSAQKILSNTLGQVIIRAINILVGVFNLALITRILGQTGFGYYTTIFAFLQTLMTLADLGLYLSLLREISTAKDNAGESKIVSNIFTIRLVSSLIIVLLAPLLIKFLPYDPAVRQGVIFFLGVFFFQSFISTLTAVFSKKMDMPKAVAVDLLAKALISIILIYYYFNPSGLNAILLWHSAAYALAFFIFYILLSRHVKLTLAWDFVYWRRVMTQSWPLAVTVVLNLVYFKADTLILSAYFPPEIVALYGAPYRVLEVMATFPHMFMSLILPLITAAWLNNNKDKWQEIYQNSFNFLAALAIPMIITFWLISKPLMVLLAGAQFLASGPILNLLILATACIFFGTLYSYLVVATGQQKKMIKYFLLAAIVGLGGYFIFIPRFSYWGAAGITLLVEAMIWYFAWRVAQKELKFVTDFKVLLKSLVSGLIMFIIGLLISPFNVWVAFGLASIVYLLMMYWLKAVDKVLLKELLIKKNI